MWLTCRDKRFQVRGGATARDVMLSLGLDPEAFLVLRNGKLVDDSAILSEGDEVELIAVISGG